MITIHIGYGLCIDMYLWTNFLILAEPKSVVILRHSLAELHLLMSAGPIMWYQTDPFVRNP